MIKDLSINEKQANNRTSDKQDQNKNYDNKQMSYQQNSKMNSNLLINTYLNQSDN